MYSMGYFLFDIALACSCLWIVNRFWSSFFEKKKSILSVIVWLCYMLWQFAFIRAKGEIHVTEAMVNIALIMLVAVCCYQGRRKEKYFLMAVFYSVWALAEMLTFYVMRSVQMEQSQMEIIGPVVSQIITMVFVHIFPIMLKEKKHSCIPPRYYFLLLLVPAGSVYIAIVEFFSIGNTFFSLTTVSVLLAFNIIVFEISARLSAVFASDTEKTVYTQQLEIISKSTEEQKKMMAEFHEEKHNLTNELIALKNRIEMGDKETAIKNLNKIIKSTNVTEDICSSGNSTVDAIVNFKYAVAKESGIKFLLKIHIPEEMPIDQCDLGVVLGNAIDNAIEATRECSVNEKVIEITLGVRKEALIVIVKNPYEHRLSMDRNGNILSTKKEKKRHGFGLNSIKRITEEYGGATILDFGHNRFSLTATMNFRSL